MRDTDQLRRLDLPAVVRSAAFFDLDKTVIAKSSALAFGRPFYRDGLITRRDMVKSAYAQLMFRLGGADEQQMARIRDHVAELCRGWRVEQVNQIVHETLDELINPYVYAEAAALIEEHRAAGRDVVVVSTSGEEMVRPIAEQLGITDVIATRMVVRGRPLHRRGRVLRGRADQGRGRPRAGQGARLRPDASLRVLGLDLRRPAAGDRRPPDGGQPGPRAAPDRRRAGLAGARVPPPGAAVAAPAGPRPRCPWRAVIGGRRRGRDRPGRALLRRHRRAQAASRRLTRTTTACTPSGWTVTDSRVGLAPASKRA